MCTKMGNSFNIKNLNRYLITVYSIKVNISDIRYHCVCIKNKLINPHITEDESRITLHLSIAFLQYPKIIGLCYKEVKI